MWTLISLKSQASPQLPAGIWGQSKRYKPDLWSRDPDTVLKYVPPDVLPLIGRPAKDLSIWQWDKFKYARQ